ncbi:MAG: AraC family transcriptional regulator [Clostridiales Family XIII bacterium]|jgi:transcriptional regulator GlxA family with amidase domain|nr:AraC family transcriptional regulator [Clostridiales Family XIII bacterium]
MSRADRAEIARVQLFIDGNYGTALTVEQLAKLACMSASKFKYAFKAVTGTTIHRYVTDIRVREAKRLLAETDMPIAQVAAQTGYKKAGAFTAVFKQNTGSKPIDYRRNAHNQAFSGEQTHMAPGEILGNGAERPET